MELVKSFGGLRTLIPIKQSGAAWDALVMAIGERRAKELQASHKGESIYIPRCQKALVAARWAKIHADYDDGKTVAELARDYILSYRQIENILKKPTQAPNQPSAPDAGPSQGQLFI
jgi:Mor family transcriptional regulator